MKQMTLALVAHDAKKDDMADFVAKYENDIRPFTLFATGTTGGRVMERCPELSVTRLKSGPLGGDQQIGAMIAEGQIDALFFFVDPLSPASARRRREGADAPCARLQHPDGARTAARPSG